MTQHTIAPSIAPPASRSTRALLAAGVAAGPLFVALAAIQARTRDGFDLRRHPISLLSLGDLGWIQITAFVLVGLLCVSFAVGMRWTLHPGPGGTWGPLLVGAFGVGLFAGGVFVTDPALGFPPGAANPDQPSWHSTVHDFAPGLALDALIVACFVLVRRFGRKEQAWMAYSAATGVAVLVLTWWPDPDGISVRLAVAVTVAFGWMTALAVRLITENGAR